MPCWETITYEVSTLDNLFENVGDKTAFLEELSKVVGTKVSLGTTYLSFGTLQITQDKAVFKYSGSQGLRRFEESLKEARRRYARRKVNEAAKRLGWNVKTVSPTRLKVFRRFA